MRRRISFVVAFVVYSVSLVGTTAELQKARPATQESVKGFGYEAKKIHYLPGDVAPMHEHKTPRLVVVLQGGQLEVENEQGAKRVITLDTGSVSFRDAEKHALKNVGQGPIDVVEMELPENGR
jgi:quercetin dioxygenase-like cupin family protein